MNQESGLGVARTVRRAARIAAFGGVTAAMLPAFVAHEAVTPLLTRDDVRRRWLGAWSSALLAIFGLRVTARGQAPGGCRGHLVVANHRSTADILVLLQAFGGRMVSRADLAGWPLVGAAARAVGTVFVDRKDAMSGANAVRSIRSLLADGATVIVFPEGTTFPGDDVRRFHAGAFVAALHSGADVVPVGIAYQTGSGAAFFDETFPAHLARMAAARPSRVAMSIGAPIVIDGKSRGAHLRDQAEAAVQRLVVASRRLVDESPGG